MEGYFNIKRQGGKVFCFLGNHDYGICGMGNPGSQEVKIFTGP